jgi:hypothetical protein
MRRPYLLAGLVLLTACGHKLSKDEALKLLPAETMLCATTLPGSAATFNPDGIKYRPGDRCADVLRAAGLLSGKKCDPMDWGYNDAGAVETMPMCRSEVVGPEVRHVLNEWFLRYSCGSVTHIVDSVTTEGLHATVRYTSTLGSPEPKSLGDCAQALPVEVKRTFTATRDDDGRWTADAPAAPAP